MRVENIADYPQYWEQATKWFYDQWNHLDNRTWDECVREFQSRFNKGKIPMSFIALDGEDMVGMGGVVFGNMHPDYGDLGPWYGYLLVKPEMRGRRISELILDRCLKETKALGHDKIYVWADPDVIDFHRKQGWEDFHPEDRILYRKLN